MRAPSSPESKPVSGTSPLSAERRARYSVIGLGDGLAVRPAAGGLRWGVEPICAVLSEHGVKIAPSTYYEWRDKLPSRRDQRDEVLLEPDAPAPAGPWQAP